MDLVSAHRPVVAHGKPGTAADVDDEADEQTSRTECKVLAI